MPGTRQVPRVRDARNWLRPGCLGSRLIETAVAALAFAPAVCLADDDAAKRQFLSSCGTCHTVEPGAPNRQGPNLAGVVGRKAATVDGFKYSSALTESRFVWDETTLDRWIEDAQAMLPGTSMLYRQRDPDKRQAIISYLKSIKP
jgi:cytochrome c